MSDAPFALTIETPLHEAVVVYEMSPGQFFSFPVSTEADAYRLCKECGIFGFWRLKSRRPR